MNEKSKEEILKIISKPLDYQKWFVKLAYEIAYEKNYIDNSRKAPFPLNKNELGTEIFSDIKENFINKGIKFGFFVFVFLAIGIFILGFVTTKEGEANMGLIFSFLVLSLFLLILVIRFFRLNKSVDKILIFEKGIELKKTKNEDLFFYDELGIVEISVNKKANIVTLIEIRSKWHEEFSVVTKNMAKLSELLSNILGNKCKINILK